MANAAVGANAVSCVYEVSTVAGETADGIANAAVGASAVSCVYEVSIVAGETADGIANAAVGASAVSCVSTTIGAAETVVESELVLVVLDSHSSLNVHDCITHLLSAWSIFTVVLQGLHNDPL